MKSSILSLLKFLIGWPLSLVALFFIVKLTSTNFPLLITNIIHADFALLFWGIICFVLYFFVRSFLWQHILKQQGYNFSLAEVSFLWSISEIRRYIPGNIWSFLSRTLLFESRQVPKRTIVAALFTEAQLVTVGAVLFTACSLPFVSYLIPQLKVFSFLFPFAYLLALLLTLAYIFAKVLVKVEKGKNKSYLSAFLPQFSPKTNTTQLGISLLSFLLFGLGSYFVAASIVYLSPEQIVGYSLFFIFSFFVGYISLITPMGIGVREAVTTAGLIHTIAASIAAAAALFLRLIFIISELLALGFTYGWFHIKNSYVKQAEKFTEKNKHVVALFLFIFIYITYFTTASFLRFSNFFTGRFDLGNMDQTVWNTMHGRIFMFTNPDGTEVLSRLAFHADLILVLLAPFYALWRDPRMLLLLQTVILACGALFIYLIAQKIHKNKNLSLTFAAVYLLNPSLQYTNLYDFHAVTIATTCLLGTYYFAMQKKYWLFFLFAILSGLCKEEIWFIIGLFGLYFFFVQRKKLLGISVFAIFTSLTYYIIAYLIPQTRGSSHFALSFFSDYGDSPLSIVKTILFSPQKVIPTFFEPSRLLYLNQLFMPVGYFSFFAPLFLIFAGPDLLINILSSNNNFHQLYYQYTATITPFVFISGIYGFSYIKKRFFMKNTIAIWYLLLLAVVSAYFYGPLPGAKSPNIDMFTRTQSDREFIAQYLREIPRQYSVAATNNLGAHLSHRKYLFTIPTGVEKADVIAFLLGDKFAQPSPDEQVNMVAKLKNNPNYILRVEKGNFFVFEKLSDL